MCLNVFSKCRSLDPAFWSDVWSVTNSTFSLGDGQLQWCIPLFAPFHKHIVDIDRYSTCIDLPSRGRDWWWICWPLFPSESLTPDICLGNSEKFLSLYFHCDLLVDFLFLLLFIVTMIMSESADEDEDLWQTFSTVNLWPRPLLCGSWSLVQYSVYPNPVFIFTAFILIQTDTFDCGVFIILMTMASNCKSFFHEFFQQLDIWEGKRWIRT